MRIYPSPISPAATGNPPTGSCFTTPSAKGGGLIQLLDIIFRVVLQNACRAFRNNNTVSTSGCQGYGRTGKWDPRDRHAVSYLHIDVCVRPRSFVRYPGQWYLGGFCSGSCSRGLSGRRWVRYPVIFRSRPQDRLSIGCHFRSQAVRVDWRRRLRSSTRVGRVPVYWAGMRRWAGCP